MVARRGTQVRAGACSKLINNTNISNNSNKSNTNIELCITV